MGRREVGKETNTEKVQGRKGREISGKAGSGVTDRSVAWLRGQGQ